MLFYSEILIIFLVIVMIVVVIRRMILLVIVACVLSRSGAAAGGFGAGSSAGVLSAAGSGGSLAVPAGSSSPGPSSRRAGGASVAESYPLAGASHGSGAPESVRSLGPVPRLLPKPPQGVLLLQNGGSGRPGAPERGRAAGGRGRLRAVWRRARGSGRSGGAAAGRGRRERGQPSVPVFRFVSQRRVAGSEVSRSGERRAAA